MKALKVVKYGRFPSLIIEQKPKRSHRQDILVRMKFAPINPSDINFFQGRYGIRKIGTPIVGFEGSGVIQQAENQALQGRTVSVLANSMNGTYCSHIITNLKDIILWPQQINSSIQQLSMAWINPFSCLGLVSKTSKYFPSEVFISAATSSLSRIIIPQLRRKSKKKLTIYGFSRNPQYDKQLLQLGYDVILRTNLQTLQLQFKTKVISKQSAVFLDCIGGQFASQIFKLLPHNSVMINYGRLSKQQLKIDVADLYFKNKNISGFWLNQFISQISQIEFQKFKSILQTNFKPFTQKIRKVFPIASHLQAYKSSISEGSEGKILLDLQ